jgi:coenzyme F420-reducing hydrogenase beta subunit
MKFNSFGEYIPVENEAPCPVTCDLCLKVCPFSKENICAEDSLSTELFSNIPGINYRTETGYFLDTFVGYSQDSDRRLKSASGGIATWILDALLSQKLVDCVICVSPSWNDEKLFEYRIFNTDHDLSEVAGSVYYPVEISEVLNKILKEESRRYAIVGLPCVCKAIRLAMCWNRKLRECVCYILGLTCGQGKSKFFSEYVCALSGGNPDRLARIDFRVKDPKHLASNFSMKTSWFTEKGEFKERKIFRSEGIGHAWGNRYFAPNACNFCDDVFAECADIVFMDAWLPDFIMDWKGTNIVLVRNEALAAVLNKGMCEKAISLHNAISIEDVIKSQLGVIEYKKERMRLRVKTKERWGDPLARQITTGDNGGFSWIDKQVADVRLLISRKSKKAWLQVGKRLDTFESKLNFQEYVLLTLKFINRIWRIAGLIYRRLCGRAE